MPQKRRKLCGSKRTLTFQKIQVYLWKNKLARAASTQHVLQQQKPASLAHAGSAVLLTPYYVLLLLQTAPSVGNIHHKTCLSMPLTRCTSASERYALRSYPLSFLLINNAAAGKINTHH